MNYLVRIAYDGSKFYGFQRLKDNLTVQKVVEEALRKINKREVEIKGAGRTDRGVHAMDQCISFRLDIDITTDGLKKAMNSLIGPYIYVTEVKEVLDDFHARFSVVSKRYLYKINLGEYNPIIADYVLQLPYKLDIDKMKELINVYKGVHNFKNFVSGERDNYECIIYDISFDIKDDILEIEFYGKSFYRYMVRNLVGSMIDVGRGNKTVDDIKKMLDTEEAKFSYTAPACGLYLKKIEY